MTHFDIAIIGGGPAGATAAALLAQQGLRVALCEQKKFPRHKVCGELLSASAFPILQRLGLLDQFQQLAGPPIRRALILPSAGPVLETPIPPGPHNDYPRALSRAAFDDLLLHRAAESGATILQPAHISSLTGSAHEGFTLQTSQHTTLRARLVILAHGLPRSPLNGDPETPTARNTFICFKTHFTHCNLPDDAIALAGAPGAYAGLVRTALHPSHSSFPSFVLAFVVRRSHIARLGPSADAHLAALLVANPALRKIFSTARRITPWLASGPLAPGLRTLHSDGCFLIGNAAAELHPLLGEGMALALQSSAHITDTLTEYFIRIRANYAALNHTSTEFTALSILAARYRTAFLADFLPRHRASRLFAALITHPSLSAFASSLAEESPALLSLFTNIFKPPQPQSPIPPSDLAASRSATLPTTHSLELVPNELLITNDKSRHLII